MPHDGATNVPTTATLILKYEDADNDAMLPYNDPAAMVPLSIVDDNGVVVSANGMWDGQDQLTFTGVSLLCGETHHYEYSEGYYGWNRWSYC